VKAHGNRYRLWNLAASLITLIVLVSAGGRIKDFFLHAQGEGTSVSSAPAETGAPAAESKSGESKGEEPESPNKEIFLWINFLLLAGGLWYLLKKMLGPYLQARGDAIREEMKQSSKALEDASQRLSAIEDKLRLLDQEIGSLRSSALEEAAAERVRIEERTNADAQKISQTAEQEIAAAAKLARQELRVYASELAIGLAEKKIRDTISPESEGTIFRSFLEDLKESGSNGGAASGHPAGKGGS